MDSCTRPSTVWPSTPQKLIQKNFKTAKPTKREKNWQIWYSDYSRKFSFERFLVKIYGDTDVGDILMLTTLEWWQLKNGELKMVTISSLDDRISMLLTKIAKSVTNIWNLSPTHFVANVCHQHILLRTFVTNIVVSGFTIWTENGLKLDKKYLVSKIEKLESSERSWIEITFQWDLWNVTFPTSNYPT